MTCAACGFENQESNENCFRCGRDLNLDKVDVEPERLKRGTPSARPRGNPFQSLLDWRKNRLRRYERGVYWRPYGLLFLAASLVPGLGQLLQGSPRRALLAALCWSVAVYFDGPDVMDYLSRPTFLTLSVHVAIALDAYRHESPRHRWLDWAELLLLAGLLWTAVNSSFLWTQFFPPPEQIAISNAGYLDPRLQNGDAVVIRRKRLEQSLPLASGTVALYHHPYRSALADRERQIYGSLMATVLAVPHQVVRYESLGGLTVHGVATPVPEWLRTAWSGMAPQRLQLKANEFLVIPPIPVENPSLDVFVIPLSDIDGMGERIVAPPSRVRNLIEVR